MSNLKPEKATCAHTGLTIPECACVNCIEAQIRRFCPRLATSEARSARSGPPGLGETRSDGFRTAA